MALPPLPAFKPGPEGYTFCPKCAAMWGGIILLLGVAAWYWYTQIRKP